MTLPEDEGIERQHGLQKETMDEGSFTRSYFCDGMVDRIRPGARANRFGDSESVFEALRQGDMTRVKVAINNGVDVNSRDLDGNTLLMQAAVYATAADLEFLLTRGADVNAANKAGHTALMRAMPDLAKIKL